jgi:cytidine deaminase
MAKQITGHYTFDVFDSINNLNSEDQNLLTAAINAINNAYAPYSNFYVGAAVLLENGKIITGNNQENAAYPSGLCAERVAIFYASSQYPGIKIKSIAVSANSKKYNINYPIAPCGSCRQAISEYEVKMDSPIRLIMFGESGEIYISPSISNLLPLMFSSKNLSE